VSGYGLKGTIDGKEVLAGNAKLLRKFGISYPADVDRIVETVVVVAVNGKYAGYITIADEIKEDAAQAVQALRAMNIRAVMLSGDKQSVVNKVAETLGMKEAFGDLLPDGKVAKVQALKDEGRRIAFV